MTLRDFYKALHYACWLYAKAMITAETRDRIIREAEESRDQLLSKDRVEY